jgi:tellurium resistance protein TerD
VSVPLARGANVALTQENPDLRGVVLGVRWSTGADQAFSDSLVSAALLCDANNDVLSDQHFVFFNQMVSPDASVARLEQLMGDDKEQVEVDLGGVPPEVERINLLLYVNEGGASRKTLGDLRSCVVRVLDLATNRELVRSEDLARALGSETALVLGHLYRHRTGWKFRVVGQGYSTGLAGVAADFGLAL